MRRDLVVGSRGERLAATLHEPTRPVAGVVMVGGSGPTDHDNDVPFPPVRDHLVAHGVAVLSCDRPGVGGSTGDWREASRDDLGPRPRPRPACVGLCVPRRAGRVGPHGAGGRQRAGLRRRRRHRARAAGADHRARVGDGSHPTLLPALTRWLLDRSDAAART